MVSFGSKAETLATLEELVKTAKILPQIRFSVGEWDPARIKEEIQKKGWNGTPLIVRSSAQQEDGHECSLAGHFESVADLRSLDEVHKAVERVISSYGEASKEDQVFIQPMLQAIQMSGVAFSCDPTTGAPYRVINYDDETGSTDSVTSGTTNALKVYYAHRGGNKKHPKGLDQIIKMLEELESYFEEVPLDVEFAVNEAGDLFLFQVRPLLMKKGATPVEEHAEIVKNIENKLAELGKKRPYLHGEKGIFGVMPDWNPAEIIGVRPRPLALSLYKEIVTDSIWAYQRDNYGYRNLRSFPLLIHFQGLPYIDVRVSFNSFITSDLEDALAEKLVNYYLRVLEAQPHLHDKVEFEIIYSCYTLDLEERLEKLKKEGFSQEEIVQLQDSLRRLTNRIIDSREGLCSQDIARIEKLEKRFQKIQSEDLDTLSKIYWLLEDCKRYGTLPFAGIARAGFIAMQFLKSLEGVGILTSQEIECFLASLSSVCSEMQQDRVQLSKKGFLEKYGHLREGTYDILSARYDENPDYYFNWDHEPNEIQKRHFSLTLKQMKQIEETLDQHGLNHNVISLFEFIKSATEGREYSKFVFTRSLSEVLRLIKILGEEHGFSPEECSYIDIQDLKKLYSCSGDIKTVLTESIAKGKKTYAYTKEILLPPLITDPKDVWSFNLHQTEPNFITLQKTSGEVACIEGTTSENLSEKIVMIPSADPGYDWIFTHPIKGLITMYGGVNSHMAIRAAEVGIPAVIGAGEILYQKYSRAKVLEVNCENKTVRIIQ